MLKWAERDDENLGKFYGYYMRLVPTEVEGVITGNLKVVFYDPTQRPAGYERSRSG